MAKDLASELAALKLRRDEPRPRRWAWLVWLVVLAAVGVGGALAYPMLEARIFKTEVEVTEILSVSPSRASSVLTSSGYIVAMVSSDVGPTVAGRIKSISLKEGDTVKKGDVIAVLEHQDREAALRAARSRVGATRSRVDVAKADLAALEQKAKRERALAKEGVSAPAIAEDLERQVEAAKRAVEAAQSEVKSASADVKGIQVDLNYMTVKAPIDGTVVGKPVGEGAMVGPFVGAILKLVDFSSLVVETDVPENRVHQIEVGTPTEILLDAFPDKRFRGKVERVGPRVDRAKATVVVKVAFVDPSEGVLPDMAARVNFLSEALDPSRLKEKPKTVVPHAAIATRGGDKGVFVIDAENARVRFQPIAVGQSLEAGFELTSGPAPGTKIVKNPPATLQDGGPIREKQP